MFGNFVDLPANGNGLHFEGEDDEAARGLKNLEWGIAERRSRIVARVGQVGLRRGHGGLTRRRGPRCSSPERRARDTSGLRLAACRRNRPGVLHWSILVSNFRQ